MPPPYKRHDLILDAIKQVAIFVGFLVFLAIAVPGNM